MILILFCLRRLIQCRLQLFDTVLIFNRTCEIVFFWSEKVLHQVFDVLQSFNSSLHMKSA